MKQFFPKFLHRGIRLQLTISLIFVFFTLPFMVVFMAVTYQANVKVMETQSNQFIEKSVPATMRSTEQLLTPIVNSVKVAAALMQASPDHFREASSASYLYEMVASSESVHSAYAAYEDGSFRHVRRAFQDKPVFNKPIPSGTKIIDRFIDARKAGKAAPLVDAYRFHAQWGHVLNEDAGPASFDPRARSWYQNASKQKGLLVSDVYPFASSGMLGITITAPIVSNGRFVGVFGVDLTLQALSKYLASNRVTPNSLTIVADESGGIIAHPDPSQGGAQHGGGLAQNRLNKLDDERVLAALAERLKTRQDRLKFVVGSNATEYIASFSPFPKDFGKPWEVLILTPTDDFVGDLKQTNQRLLVLGVIVFALQLALIYYLSRTLSRPIEQLARDVSRIRRFKFDETSPVQSSVTEIRHLSRAVQLLTETLRSFTAYVPRELVQQLIATGHGSKLGMESKYLTLFFADIEGFTHLSETEPSLQLLTQVSTYFATLNAAIEASQGTIDKYIGDAVMAFWGAPNPIEAHPYHACVAAVRAQRRMAVLNQAWELGKLPHLKVRIGIHSDAVLVGNVGTTDRMSYTVMGDGVNIASRLEGINKELGTSVCVSHMVFREVGDRLWLRPIDTVAIKGHSTEIVVYELLGIRDGDAEVGASDADIRRCDLTGTAHAEYLRNNFSVALQHYGALLAEFPHDKVAQRMAEKCRLRLAGA
jgi:adenylate cyclase